MATERWHHPTSGLVFHRFFDGHHTRIYVGYSVIFHAIQIACYLGARRVVMLGVDMNYTGNPAKDYAIARNDVLELDDEL